MSGSCHEPEIPIIIHYGLDPIFGRYMKDERGFFDARVSGDNRPFLKDALEIFDLGGGLYSRVTDDIRRDHIWLLRHLNPGVSTPENTDALGIWDPEDIQPLKRRSDLGKLLPAR